MSVFDDRVTNYAVEPAAKAGGLAAGVILLATIFHVPRPVGVRAEVLFVGTFFAVFLGYLVWRVIRRAQDGSLRSEEHTSELQSQSNLVCRLLLEKKNIPSARPPTALGHQQRWLTPI